jgi:hypothetical protein
MDLLCIQSSRFKRLSAFFDSIKPPEFHRRQHTSRANCRLRFFSTVGIGYPFFKVLLTIRRRLNSSRLLPFHASPGKFSIRTYKEAAAHFA